MACFKCEHGVFVKASGRPGYGISGADICFNCPDIFSSDCSDPGDSRFTPISQEEYETGKAAQDKAIVNYAKTLLREFSPKVKIGKNLSLF